MAPPASAEVSEAARLRAEIAQARRRGDSARAACRHLREEVGALRKQWAGTAVKRSSHPAAAVPAATVVGPSAGDQVRIAGCSEAPQLNGQDAEVVSVDARKARCKVKLRSGEQRQLPQASLGQIPQAGAVFCPGTAPEPPQGAGGARPPSMPPLLSASSLRLRSVLSSRAAGVPCELWPFVYSSLVRVQMSGGLLERLCKQVDAAASCTRAPGPVPELHGEVRRGHQVPLERPDGEYMAKLLEVCKLLAWALLGTHDCRCEVDAVWGVVQRAGDYTAIQSHRNRKSPVGFSSVLDVRMPPALAEENHDRPSKGAYGFHDGLHNFLWKGDRSTDRDDLVQPGIIQCELTAGYLYVFPQWFQTLTYPFEGEGERTWVAANIALFDVPPEM